MKKRINKKASVFLAASVFSFSFATAASVVSATTAHPAPSPIIDVWQYGVDNSYGYSNYFVSSPDNIGSKFSVTNYWGTVKAYDKKRLWMGIFKCNKILERCSLKCILGLL